MGDAEARYNYWAYYYPTEADWDRGARWLRCDGMVSLKADDSLFDRWSGVRSESPPEASVQAFDANDCSGMDLIELMEPPISSELSGAGISVLNSMTGEFVGMGGVIDQIWIKTFGIQEISEKDLEVSLTGGWLGSGLRQTFGSDQYVYDRVVAGFRAKAAQGGAPCYIPE